MDRRTIDWYEANSAERATIWESVASPLASVLPLLYSNTDTVLDVGCGSGRDLALLMRLGVDAEGIDPVAALAAETVRRHPELDGRIAVADVAGWSQSHAARYDGVILSAVLMHVPDSELFDFVLAVRRLVKPGATVVVSVPQERADVDPATGRDGFGRLFTLRSESQLALFFERLGFRVESRFRSADALGRDALWLTIVFRYTGESPRPIDRVEAIINRDRKTATYKLALLRALAEIAISAPALARPAADGTVRIPLAEIALLWVEYYWPLLAGDRPIAQNWNSRGPVRFYHELRALAAAYDSLNGLSAWRANTRTRRVPTTVAHLQRDTLRAIVVALKTGPITYAGDQEFAHRAGDLVVRADLWREFVLMGHWIIDSILLRWAELVHQKESARQGGTTVTVAEILDRLLVSAEDRRQDPGLRDFYRAEAGSGGLVCTWTGSGLRSAFDVDHIIPFAVRRDSSLWNLVPAASRVNNEKRDRLPTLERLEGAEDRIVAAWTMVHEWNPDRFRADAARLVPGVSDWRNWERPLLSALAETVEATATVRGVERW